MYRGAPLVSSFVNISVHLNKYTRGAFRQVPTRRIRLSFVECAYLDLRDIYFFHNFRGLKWIPL